MTNEPTKSPAAPANGLERKLGLFPLTNIVIANMVGAGIFTTSGLLMGTSTIPWSCSAFGSSAAWSLCAAP